MNSWYHSKSSAKKWGGHPTQYIDIHEMIDGSKRIVGDVRHRSMYHHTEGVWLCQRIFGRTITVGGRYPVPVEADFLSEEAAMEPSASHTLEVVDYGPLREIPVRLIAELHIIQDLGWIPSPSDYIKNMELKQWMGGAIRKEQDIEDMFPAHPPKGAYFDKKPNSGTGALDSWDF